MEKNSALDLVSAELRRNPKLWLVTGAAGFIGSHLVEELLRLGQSVVGVDNFSNGTRENLADIRSRVPDKWSNFEFIEGDICDQEVSQQSCEGVNVVLHHAALGSVPRSIENPLGTNRNNITGFLTLLEAAKNGGTKRFIYASSSSVYGDNSDLPKVESRTGRPLSPYAVTKVTNELYAHTFATLFEMEIIGLRYFNVFGPRQQLNGPYAAVIPKWINALLNDEEAQIFGDGSTSRDFCYVKNVVHMNLLAATTKEKSTLDRVFNTACGKATSLSELFNQIRGIFEQRQPHVKFRDVVYSSSRKGEILHSQANMSDASLLLGFHPLYQVADGLQETIDWYLDRQNRESSLSSGDARFEAELSKSLDV